MKKYKVNCTHCKKTSNGILGDKNWVYGKDKDLGSANCHHCGARNKADIVSESFGVINPNGVGVELRQALAKYNHGEMNRNDLIKEVERLMWKARTNDPQNFELVKSTLDRMKKANNEGYGGLDMSKDKKQAFKGAHWTVKFDEVAEPGGRTPSSEAGIMELINRLKSDQALAFYGLTSQKRVFVRKTGDGWIEVVDHMDNTYRLNPRADNAKIKLVANQIATVWRKLSLYKIMNTIPSRMAYQPSKKIKGATITKNELREVISELIQETMNEFDKSYADSDPEKCKKCGEEYQMTGEPNPYGFCPDCMNQGDAADADYRRDMQGGVDESNTTWNPQSFTKTPEEVSTLIFGLDEGEGITFMSDKQGRSSDWVAVEKTVEGDEYVYKHFTYRDQGNKHYLETDEDVLNLATEIAKNPKLILYSLHEVTTQDGQAYKKASRQDYGHEDQSTGDYEKYGADQPSWKELYEAKGNSPKDKLRNIILETINEDGDEFEYDEETEKQLINSIASIARTAIHRISSLRPEEIQRYFREIDRMAEKLVNMHKGK